MLDTFKTTTPETLAHLAEEKNVRRTDEVFLLFSMGSQFDHLIRLALGRLGVFSIVGNPSTMTAEDVRVLAPIGIILSGGPASVYSEPPPFDPKIFDLGIPTLGICLGFQMWAKRVGAPVIPAVKREFGTHIARQLRTDSLLFAGCEIEMQVLESHGDRIEPANQLRILASTDNAPVAAADCGHLYGVQFHPEVIETRQGPRIFENFCFKICGAKDRYPAEEIAKQKIQSLRDQIGDRRVLLALSGGSDSSTLAYLLKKALAVKPTPHVCAIYIKGIDRPDDEAHVREFFGNQAWVELKVVDATEGFLAALKGIKDGREKRLAFRSVYKALLEQEALAYGASFIAQGTLYTDLSESGGGYKTGARKAVIKIHHNTDLRFYLPELTPLDDCVKDGARNIGRSIGVPERLLTRHPFPGPGLVIRVEDEVTREKLAMAREIDGIYVEELRRWNLYDAVWQAGAVVTSSRHTYTKGDDAGIGWVIAFWAVTSMDGFTAPAFDFPRDFEKHLTQRIGNEVSDVGAVVFRVSGKPFSTIEWE